MILCLLLVSGDRRTLDDSSLGEAIERGSIGGNGMSNELQHIRDDSRYFEIGIGTVAPVPVHLPLCSLPMQSG